MEKKIIVSFILILTLTILISGCLNNYKYVNFTSESESISFEYPEGWNVSVNDYPQKVNEVRGPCLNDISICKDSSIDSPKIYITILKPWEIPDRENETIHFVSIRDNSKTYNKTINGINCRVYEDFYSKSWYYYFSKGEKTYEVSGMKEQAPIEKIIETIHQ